MGINMNMSMNKSIPEGNGKTFVKCLIKIKENNQKNSKTLYYRIQLDKYNNLFDIKEVDLIELMKKKVVYCTNLVLNSNDRLVTKQDCTVGYIGREGTNIINNKPYTQYLEYIMQMNYRVQILSKLSSENPRVRIKYIAENGLERTLVTNGTQLIRTNYCKGRAFLNLEVDSTFKDIAILKLGSQIILSTNIESLSNVTNTLFDTYAKELGLSINGSGPIGGGPAGGNNDQAELEFLYSRNDDNDYDFQK